jgi:hypothetical protein
VNCPRLLKRVARFHRDSGCPFGFSFDGQPIARFPFGSEQLELFFGSPDRIEEYPYK